MADSKQLYQEVILDHNRKPRNWGTLPDATHQAEGVNPLCGDHIHLTLKVDADALQIAHDSPRTLIAPTTSPSTFSVRWM